MKTVVMIKLFVVLALLWPGQEVFAQPEALPLVISDCNKCHLDIARQVFEQGGQHKDALDCLGCHMEHPPQGTDSVPECGMCHEQDSGAHYKVNNCLGCHNPHAPLDLDINGVETVREACASCHTDQNNELEEYSSAHSEMDCKDCHQSHGEYFNCLECHEVHSDKIDEYKDCLLCHKPHMPTVVRYPDDISVSYCSGCHAQPTRTLQGSPFKHSTFKCVFCHRGQHRSLPVCVTCHGQPHALSLHKKFPDCKECHNTAHDLE